MMNPMNDPLGIWSWLYQQQQQPFMGPQQPAAPQMPGVGQALDPRLALMQQMGNIQVEDDPNLERDRIMETLGGALGRNTIYQGGLAAALSRGGANASSVGGKYDALQQARKQSEEAKLRQQLQLQMQKEELLRNIKKDEAMKRVSDVLTTYKGEVPVDQLMKTLGDTAGGDIPGETMISLYGQANQIHKQAQASEDLKEMTEFYMGRARDLGVEIPEGFDPSNPNAVAFLQTAINEKKAEMKTADDRAYAEKQTAESRAYARSEREQALTKQRYLQAAESIKARAERLPIYTEMMAWQRMDEQERKKKVKAETGVGEIVPADISTGLSYDLEMPKGWKEAYEADRFGDAYKIGQKLFDIELAVLKGASDEKLNDMYVELGRMGYPNEKLKDKKGAGVVPFETIPRGAEEWIGTKAKMIINNPVIQEINRKALEDPAALSQLATTIGTMVNQEVGLERIPSAVGPNATPEDRRASTIGSDKLQLSPEFLTMLPEVPNPMNPSVGTVKQTDKQREKLLREMLDARRKLLEAIYDQLLVPEQEEPGGIWQALMNPGSPRDDFYIHY